ncbi:MAG: CHAT domain-containing protein [Rhodocyclaceae bacterium]|nr:CHAT domain-containing protein [Rhodocyclaceae bacterium]
MDTKMRRFSVGVALIVSLGIMAAARADEGLTYLESAGRYGDMAQQVETRLARGEAPTASLVGPLCLAYGQLKRFDKLFDCVVRLETAIAAGDRVIKGDYFIGTSVAAEPFPGMLRAEAYMDLGDFARAMAEGERALAAVPTDASLSSTWPRTKFQLVILPNLAIAAVLGGDKERSRRYLAALEDVSIGFVGSAMTKPLKENGLARVYLALGEYDKAIEHLGSRGLVNFVMALADATNAHAYRGDSLATLSELPRQFMLAKADLELGRLDEARQAFDAMFANQRLPDLGDIYWVALAERARLEALEQRPDEAIADLKRAVDVIETQRASIHTEASKIGFVGDKQAVYRRLVAALIGQGRTAAAFDYVERSKSRALVDMLAARKEDFAIHGADPEKTRQVLAQLDAADLAGHAPDAAPKVDAAGASGVRNLSLARTQVQAAAPELATLVAVSAVPSDELKSLVGQDETLIEYYGQDDELYAFVLDRQKLQAIKLDAAELERRVRDLRAAIEQVDGDAWRAPAQALYAQLWQPLAGQIAAGKVVIVPHGALHYLPFAALVAPDGSFLADRYALRFLPSASVLKFLRPASPAGQAPLLALGDPDLGDPRYDLHFAEDEARTVAGVFPGSRLLLRKDASKSNFRKAEGAFVRIHFATHGEFNAEQPLASGLHLAGDTGGDSMLTVGELYAMNLNADLVTLSACQTGLGKVASGDDVVGLTRGFLYAGARSIVASLWSVDDKATAQLMEAFYRNLATMSKEEALRQAQQATRNAFPQPFFWAAFQLTGRGD